jgi:UDP:flavonoid glycosyltransferase YjiC (YdhE family)
VYVVLGESMLGGRLPSIGGRVRVLADYPNSLDFKAFDFTIMAAGYNSYHEAIRFSVPTISIPNMNTGMDDQLARVEVAEAAGAMIVLREVTPRRVQAAIERLMQESVRKSMISSCETLHRPNGANQMSKWIINEI